MPGKGILFKKNGVLALEAYTVANNVGSLVDRRSTIEYCTFLGANLVTWRSKKHNVVQGHLQKYEFKAIAQGLWELLWLKIVLDDLRLKSKSPMKLYCDNKLAINNAHNPIQNNKTNHIEGLVYMCYVPSECQLVDVLTKGLNNSRFHDLIFKLGMEDIYSSA